MRPVPLSEFLCRLIPLSIRRFWIEADKAQPAATPAVPRLTRIEGRVVLSSHLENRFVNSFLNEQIVALDGFQ